MRLDLSMPTTATLLAKLRSGDADGWERMQSEYLPAAYDACRRKGIQPADAQDICQELLRAVVAAVDRFDEKAKVGAFRSWLAGILKFKVADHYRGTQRLVPSLGDGDRHVVDERIDTLAEEAAEDLAGGEGQLQHALHRIRSQFDERTWAIFSRSVTSRLSTAEVASEFGMNENAVRQAKHRVKQKVARLLLEFPEFAKLGKAGAP